MPPFRTLLAGLLMLVLATYGAVKAYLYFEAEQRIAAAFAPVAAVGNVHYDEFEVSLLGPVTLSGVRLVPHGGGEALEVDRLVFEAFERARPGRFPARLKIHAAGFRIEARTLERIADGLTGTLAVAPSDEFAMPGLSALGYSTVSGDLLLDWRHAPETGAVRLRLSVDWPGGGDVAMNLALEDVGTGLLTRRAPMGKFRTFSLKYRDHSLAQRALRALAEREEMDVEAFRAELLDSLERADPERPWNIGRPNLLQIRDFLGEPTGFVLTMQPYEPIALNELHHYNERDLPLLFNLQMEAM